MRIFIRITKEIDLIPLKYLSMKLMGDDLIPERFRSFKFLFIEINYRKCRI